LVPWLAYVSLRWGRVVEREPIRTTSSEGTLTAEAGGVVTTSGLVLCGQRAGCPISASRSTR
jgi:hypothetical protein